MLGWLAGLVTDVIHPPEWLIGLCKWLWRKRGFFWGTLVFGILVNLFAFLLVTPLSTSYRNTPLGGAIAHPGYLFLAGISVVAFNVLIYFGTLFDRGSDIQVERKYLRRMQEETRVLKLSGIPADLIAPGVPLDEVFIPLRFEENQPLTDQPLAESEYPDPPSSSGSAPLDAAAQEQARIRHQAITSAWRYPVGEQPTLAIPDLWQLFTPKTPALVLQGFPGMGKSTLLDRLTLHMARRGLTPDRLDRPTDPLQVLPKSSSSPTVLTPILLPILIRLGDFAEACSRHPNMSVTDYLKGSVLQRLDIRRLPSVIEKRLEAGRCLVLFDGLDEVTDPLIRRHIQEAIQTFIRNRSDGGAGRSTEYFNRFLITSRVAGYDANAFPEYLHVVVADLTPEQIDQFLPRWYRASVRRDRGVTTQDARADDSTIREAEQQARRLSEAIHTQQGVRELAVNPLLLTLLAVMQLNSIELPRQRVELYRVVTQTLLENRNIAKRLPEIAETEAMQRLGPLAYRMQAEGKRFISYADVLASIEHTILSVQGGSPDQAAREAASFVKRVRERAGLFVQRTDDYYGFFHRTFQEYFAARYLLNEITRDPSTIADIAERARRSDELWREPVLFAVAYKSKDGGDIASDMIRALLATPPHSTPDQHLHDLLLSAECVIEAKPLTIDAGLCRDIAQELFEVYATRYQVQDALVPGEIEDAISRWLASVHQDAYQHPLLEVLETELSGARGADRLSAVLTLLAMIAEQLGRCRAVVFSSLVPPLIARAQYAGSISAPSVDLPPPPDGTVDLRIAERALAALALMRGVGSPGNELMVQVRQQFANQPAEHRVVAQWSLESQVLVTPARAPLEREAGLRFLTTLQRWQQIVRTTPHLKRRNTKAVQACVAVHQELIASADQARYPGADDVVHLLHDAADRSSETWQDSWQTYLAGRLDTGHYGSYHTAALLWLALFREPPALARFAGHVERHFTGKDPAVQRCARHVLAMIGEASRNAPSRTDELLHDFAYLISVQERDFIFRLEEHLGMRYRRFPQTIQDLRNLLDRLDAGTSTPLGPRYRQVFTESGGTGTPAPVQRSLPYLRSAFAWEQIGSWYPLLPSLSGQTSRNTAEIAMTSPADGISERTNALRTRTPVNSEEVQRVQGRRDVRRCVFTHRVADHARASLNSTADMPAADAPPDHTAMTDLLAILQGRMRVLSELEESRGEDENEVEDTVRVALAVLQSTRDIQVTDSCLTLLRALPVRTRPEVEVVLKLIASSRDEQVQMACAQALLKARPLTSDAWALLAQDDASLPPTARTMVKTRLDLLLSLDAQLGNDRHLHYTPIRNRLRIAAPVVSAEF